MMQIAYFKHEDHSWEELAQKIQTHEEPVQELFWMRYLGRIRNHWWNKRGEGAKIAILDTGIDLSHPAFEKIKSTIKVRNFTNQGGRDNVEDENGHGTHVAGIIAAQPQEVKKESADDPGGEQDARPQNHFKGLAHKADLLIGKVLNKHGEGAVDWVAEGINWAVNQRANVISLSMSGTESTQALYKAVHSALAKGVCIIAAAGNGGSLSQNSIGFPGRYGGVVTVAAHDVYGRPTLFSSSGGEIDFMAPGAEIWSTFKGGKYAKLSGTSMATPFVAGLSAMIIAAHLGDDRKETPIYNNADLKAHLLRMVTHAGYHNATEGYGALIPFRTVGTKLPLNNLPDLKSTYVYGSEFEPMEEYDDRADLYQVMERKYWLNFQASESGKDWRNRFYDEYKTDIARNAKGVALIVHKDFFVGTNILKKIRQRIAKKNAETLKLKTQRHGDLLKEYLQDDLPDMIVNPETPFVDQPSVYGFTAFWIGGDKLMSCRHGFYPNNDSIKPQDYVAVFGFQMENKETCCTEFEINQVYAVQDILAESKEGDNRQDWAIVRLDREVNHPGIEKLELCEDEKAVSKLPFGTPLYVLGHPFGLPLKFSPDGQILEHLTEEYCKTNLDAFVGNSGSPVIEVETQKVIGILVTGRTGELKIDQLTRQIELVYSVGSLMQIANEKIQKIHTPLRALKRLKK